MKIILDHLMPPPGHPDRARINEALAVLESKSPVVTPKDGTRAWTFLRAWEAMQRALAAGVFAEVAPGHYEGFSEEPDA